MTATRQHRPTGAPRRTARPALHRHTPDCCWDTYDRRWRCADDRPAAPRDDFPRLLRVDGPSRRRPAAPTVRLGLDPDTDDGC